jgi:hypothetical protein
LSAENEASTGPPVLSDRTVVVTGAYGVVDWQVAQEVVSALPAEARVLIDMTEKLIDPYFVELANRLLAHCGSQAKLTELPSGPSFQTVTSECKFGVVHWDLSSGFLEALPAEDRATLFEMAEHMIHEYFEVRIRLSLMQYGYRRLHGRS